MELSSLAFNAEPMAAKRWEFSGMMVCCLLYTSLAFMLLVYGVNRRKILHRVEKDHRHQEESYKEIFRVIILVVSCLLYTSLENI